MSAFGGLKRAPMIRPMHNCGCLFDIQTGRYYPGKHGEMILNGGLPNFEIVAALPNMYKTAISLYKLGIVFSRLASAVMQAHDTENTLQVARFQQYLCRFPELEDMDFFDPDNPRFLFSDATVYPGGNEWFREIQLISRTRREDKTLPLTTPFMNEKTMELQKALPPFLSFVDSLSNMTSDTVLEMYDKNEVGESGLNMVDMRGSRVKSQIVEQMAGIAGSGGIYSIMTGHVDQEYQIDPRKPNIKRLKFLKGDLKLKKIPGNASFLSGNCWYVKSFGTLINDSTKAPEYPRDTDDDLKGDTDLVSVCLENLRGKFGPSGIPFDVVISQSEGVLPHLTEFHYIKNSGRFGLEGTLQNYYLSLLPEVKLSRTTVRGKIADNAQLCRALTITSEMCQMFALWHNLDDRYRCSPKELYETLKEKGYDWDLLLNTRGYWVFEEQQHPTPYLSTMDLLRMRTGEYHPYWYPKTLEELGLPPLRTLSLIDTDN